MFYYVQLSGGNCTIIEAKRITTARSYARQTFGSHMQPEVRKATEDEVSWVKTFGGRIHIVY